MRHLNQQTIQMGGGQSCNLSSANPGREQSGEITGTDIFYVPVLRGFSHSAKQDSEASARRAEERAKRTLSFLCDETGGGDIHSRNSSESRLRVSNENPLLGRSLAPGFPLRTLRTFLSARRAFSYTGTQGKISIKISETAEVLWVSR
jgi:hypothetical protein